MSGSGRTAAAAAHTADEWQFYHQWAQRPDKTPVYDASREIVRMIEARSGQATMIPVIGEYAAQLGLFDERIFSLDAKWSPAYPFCERLLSWEPRFHVNVVWPGSASHGELSWIARCPRVDGTREIARFPLIRDDELVLSRIDYKH